jgi:hypothetical protein
MIVGAVLQVLDAQASGAAWLDDRGGAGAVAHEHQQAAGHCQVFHEVDHLHLVARLEVKDQRRHHGDSTGLLLRQQNSLLHCL